MGEVYRARDPRLGRDVAVKILKEEASGSPERRSRFEREARAVAALNHPNILSVYDFGSSGGLFYIVSELVEGESLRQRMERGPIGVKDVYRLATQIADGMAAAHTAGITHRDLKPENVMLTGDGRAKILDFGLARQTVKGTVTEADATRTQMDTEPGRVMGTAGYMSPEQVRGLAVDHRSDQFSFGTILYEMASGQRPFSGDSTVETMNAVLKEEPKPLDTRLPAPLRWTIARCLEKDPAARYESTGDLYRELRGQQEHLSDMFTSSEAVVPAEDSTPKPRRWWVAAAGVVVVAVASAAGGAWWRGRNADNIGRLRFTPMEVTWPNARGGRWSPDGKAFAYRADVDGVTQVFLRYLTSPSPAQITRAPQGTCGVAWSADGKRILAVPCHPGRELEVSAVPVFGGEPELVAKVPRPVAADVAGGNLAVLTEVSGKLVVEVGPIGAPLRRYTPAPFETTYNLNGPTLHFSPDGKSLLLFLDVPQARTVWLLPLPMGRSAPQRVLQDLPGYGATPSCSWFPDHRRIALDLQDRHDEQQHLWIADVFSGARRRITAGTSSEESPAVSPDGKRILFTQHKTESLLVSVSLENAAVEHVLESDLSAGMPAWAMRQEKFAYTTARNGPAEIWMRGGGSDRPVVTEAMFPPGTTNSFMAPSLSPEADRLIYTQVDSHVGVSAWISSVNGGPPVRLTNESNMVEFGGSWSPDGRSFVYQRCASGNCDIAVVKTSGEATPMAIRKNVVYALPQWSPDGNWIKFFDAANGWSLISPDGKTVEVLGVKEAIDLTFSLDSRSMFGIRRDGSRAQLFSLDLQTKKVKAIGDFDREYFPNSPVGPAMRLSLAPDGKTILYPVVRSSSSLWMLEGFE